jgi:segregation and condensation protein B
MDNNSQSKIEALLFAAGEPVGVEKLSKFLKITKQECFEQLDSLEKFYLENERGVSIIKKENQVQLVSNKKWGSLVGEFLNKQTSEELSRAASEVLAVVAYRGPVSRMEIEQIRGVNCSFTLRNLAMRGLVERKENSADNRSYLYEISFDFLKSMGIESVEKLPNYEVLRSSVAVMDKEISEDNNQSTPKVDE